MVWYNPAYPHPDPPRPPIDAGKRLATCPRGEGAEFRVSLAEYEGRPYVSLRVWTTGEGGMYPSKAGCSIRLREVADVIAALRQVEDLVAEGSSRSDAPPRAQPRDDRPTYVERHTRPQPRHLDPASIPPPRRGGEPFDET